MSERPCAPLPHPSSRKMSRHRSAALVPVCIVLLGYLALAQNSPSCTSTAAVSQPSSVRGLPDLVEVTPHFYRGGQPTHEGFVKLHNLGIELVVDLRGDRDSERRQVRALGMDYVALPWHCPFPRDATFARFLKVMRANSRRKVFVHCRLGDDRVGMMVAAYRMSEQHWTAEQAMHEMKASGFSAGHHLLCPGLADYERHFPERLRTSPAFKDLR